MKKRDQPHDRYFRDLMEDINIARSFLRTYMNPKVQAQIDWSTLELYDSSLIGDNNKQMYADVVYKAQTKAQEEVFLILNHERKADRLLPIRRLEYKLGLLKKAIKQNKQPALIYFITWYNGQEVPYPYAKSIAEYFTLSELAEELLLQDEILVVKQLPDASLYKHEPINVLALFMKYADDPNFPHWLVEHPAMANKLAENKYIERSIAYMLDVGYHKYEDLLLAFEKTSEKLKQTMLTTRQQIEKIGEKRGIQQGMQQGVQTRNLEIARNMLFQLHLGLDVIEKATGLSKQELEQLQKGGLQS